MSERGLHAGILRSAAWTIVAAATVGASYGGGAFVFQNSKSPRIHDISAEARENCSQSTARTLADGVRLEVLFAPGLDGPAGKALDMMERVHDALASALGFSFSTGARLFLAQLGSYPDSFRAIDESPGTPVWAFVRVGAPDDEILRRVEQEIYGTLPHEWTHSITEERFGAKSYVWRSRWLSEGIATYVENLVQVALPPESPDEHSSRYLSLLRLEQIPLDDLLQWKNVHSLRPRSMMKGVDLYGAALGLFLRVRESGAPDAVHSFLELLEDNRGANRAEIEAALVKVTGRRYEELARMSAEEKDAAYREGLDALEDPENPRRLHGLAVLACLPDRIDQFRNRVQALADDASAGDLVRERAKAVLAGGN